MVFRSWGSLLLNPPPSEGAAAGKFKGRPGGGVPKNGGGWRGDQEGVAKKLAAGPTAETGHPEEAAAGKGQPTRCTRNSYGFCKNQINE